MSRLTTRFDISKLTGSLVDENGKDTPRGTFQDLASKLVMEEWEEDKSVDEKWHTVRSALTGAAKTHTHTHQAMVNPGSL